MALRSVFVTSDKYPYFKEIGVNFPWFGGHAVIQKQKCQISLHKNFNAEYNDKVLEVSSGSLYQLGSLLSAMSLKKHYSQGVTTVESVFQSSRVYYAGDMKIGPFPEALTMSGRDSKYYVKNRSNGLHSIMYDFEGVLFPAPLFHLSLFYDYVYISALCEPENAQVRDILLSEGFTAFTDLATKSLNTQARSCAIFLSLHNLGLLDGITDYDTYMEVMHVDKGNLETLKAIYDKEAVLGFTDRKWLYDNFGWGRPDSWDNVASFNGSEYMLLCPTVRQSYDKSDIERFYDEF